MPATALATLSPYIPLDYRTFDFLPTIANIASPTRAEINAGTDLSGQVTDAPGWSVSGTTIESQSFRGASLKLQGPKSVDESSLTMRLSRTSTDARTILTQDLACYILVMPEGDVPGRTMDVFQTIVNARPRSPGIVDPATATFQFAIVAYQLTVTIPA